MSKTSEVLMKIVFMICACVSIAAVALICVFMFANGVPAMSEIGFTEFLLGDKWRPSSDLYGIFPMIIGSIYVTAGAIIIGVPIGLLCAVFLAYYCPNKLYSIVKPAVELLAGIPSIVYGFFGLMVIVPFVKDNIAKGSFIHLGGSGKGVLTASILLGIMILPTIISTVEPNLRAVPKMYYEGSLALGATKERSVFCTIVPAAKSGVMAGVVLGIGRAIGETMAVIIVAGNQPVIPEKITSGVRTLTANIVLEMAYASDLHKDALIATAVVLFVFILIINTCFSLLKRSES